MPFGLTNAPRTFQRVMNHLIGNFEYVKIFLDDILIHSKDDELHARHLNKIMDILRSNNVAIFFEKSRFFKNKVTYLYHVIDKDGSRREIFRLPPFEKLVPKTEKSSYNV
ncbi:Retrovirus-related Pol polyprotein from transposon gypsy [Dictyocoela muelleri]|nr:Retrovirus-related Pol polyprotein from transposon gypsy [Dictyocoela muelleri]